MVQRLIIVDVDNFLKLSVEMKCLTCTRYWAGVKLFKPTTGDHDGWLLLYKQNIDHLSFFLYIGGRYIHVKIKPIFAIVQNKEIVFWNTLKNKHQHWSDSILQKQNMQYTFFLPILFFLRTELARFCWVNELFVQKWKPSKVLIVVVVDFVSTIGVNQTVISSKETMFSACCTGSGDVS